MDRAQAIEVLREKGFEARERRWSLGDSIFVGAAPFEEGAIRGYRVGTYIYPSEDGWAVIVDSRIPSLEPDAKFERLEEAVDCAAAFVSSEMAKLRGDG
jgi:hypothetical protein